MCGKYSAEWWEKIPDISREISRGHYLSSVIDDLIQVTARDKPSPTRKPEASGPAGPSNGVMAHEPAH